MPDPTLHGNGFDCPACELRRAEARRTSILGPRAIPCNRCGGTGRIARPVADIVADHVAWARQHYWSTKTYD